MCIRDSRIGFVLTSVVIALLVLLSTLFVVDQRQFGVVYQLGQIQRVITDPGLNWKLPPPVQTVVYLD